MRRSPPLYLFALVSSLLSFGCCKTQCINPSGSWFSPAPVVTGRNDNARTGANLRERALTAPSVSSGEFQKIFTYPVTGQVYAQPLYVPNVKEPNGTTRNILVVATMHNMLYLLDGDAPIKDPTANPATLAVIPLGTPVEFNYMPMAYTERMFHVGPVQAGWLTANVPSTASNDPNFYNVYPEIGVTGTPVVDTTTMRLYVVAKVRTGSGPSAVAFQLWVIDLKTRAVVAPSPVTITATVQGFGTGSANGMVAFDPQFQHQRAGLLLSQGGVYIAFGSHQDTPPFHGWVMRYDAATLAQTDAWCSTPMGSGGAIWQAGSGLAADDMGRVYAMTGNGFATGDMNSPTNFAQSFVQLSPTLGALGWFTPGDAVVKSQKDVDLGSSGPVLLPGTGVLIGAGKDGQLYLLDQNTALGMRQIFQATKPLDPLSAGGSGYHHVHGTPVVWRRSPAPGTISVYLWPERDKLRVLTYDDATAVFAPTGPSSTSTIESPAGSGPFGVSMPGGILSLSANGTRFKSGIVWASLPTSDDALHAVVPGMLRAFDAGDVTSELWNSEAMPSRDRVGLFAKYTPPTVANGRVYLATFSGEVAVYGLRQWATLVSQSTPPHSVKAGSSFTVTVIFENTGTTSWSAGTSHSLGSQAPQDNTTWGSSNRFPLPRSVAPGESVTLELPLTAPSQPGSYTMAWRMVQDGVEWFGETTATEHIEVVP